MANEFYDDCMIVNASSTASGIPNLSGITNANYVAPSRQSFFKVMLYGDATWRNFAPHLVPKTLTIVDRTRMEISTFKCTIEDLARTFNLPFEPLARMWIQVFNQDESKLYFKGYLSPPKPDPVRQRADLTEYRYIQLSANDETELFRRVPIQEVIEGTREGGMIADLCGRYVPELDPSGIDATLGAEIEKKIIDRRYLFQLIQEFLDLNPETTFWLERKAYPAKSKIWLQRRGSAYALLSSVVVDNNRYKLFDPASFWASRSTKAYKNRVVLQYHELYNQGTVNVSNGDFIVYGFGTDWYGKIFTGDTFRIPGSDSTYTVRKNNTSSDGAVQELYLSSNFEQTTLTGSAYEINREQISEEVAEDLSEQDALKILNGELGEYGGVREVVIPPGPNPLLVAEAQRLASMLLRFNLYEGGATTNNVLFGEELDAGRTLRIDCPIYGVQDDLILQEVTRKDGGGRPGSFRANKPYDPYWLYNIKLTDRLFSEEGRFEAVLLALRRPKIKDSTTIRIDKTIPERMYFKDCVGGSDGEPVDEQAYMADDVGGLDVDTVGPWYAAPAPGQKEFYAIGWNGEYSEAS